MIIKLTKREIQKAGFIFFEQTLQCRNNVGAKTWIKLLDSAPQLGHFKYIKNPQINLPFYGELPSAQLLPNSTLGSQGLHRKQPPTLSSPLHQ